MKEKNLILNENMWKVCIKLSIPAVIAMMLYGLNTIFDAFFVQKYVGDVAFAGVTVVYPLTQITLGIGSLAGTGAGAFLSILIGRGDKKAQSKIVGNVNTFMIISSVIIMILGFIFVGPLVKAVGATGEVYTTGVEYFRITLIGSIFWIAGLGYNMIVRAEGKMKTAAIMMAIGLATNVIFNYIFMAILDFGVIGAAWGTNVGMLVYVLVFIIYVKQKKASFNVNMFKLYYHKEIMSEIIKLGFPSLLMSIMTVIQGLVVMSSVTAIGSDSDLSLYGGVFRLTTFAMTPIFGLMRALQPTAGINFGAKKYARVRSSYIVYSIVGLILVMPIWIWAFLSPEGLIGTLLPSYSIRTNDIFNLRIYISMVPLLSFVLTAMTFFPSVKNPKPASIIGVGRQLFLYIPLMLILPRIFGITAIYSGAFFIDLFVSVIVLLYIRKEFVRLKKMELNT